MVTNTAGSLALFFPVRVGEALAQVAPRSCDCAPSLEVSKVRLDGARSNLGIVESVPAPGRGLNWMIFGLEWM